MRGQVKGSTVHLLQNGVRLEDGVTAPCRVRVRAQTQNNALVEITLGEGRNRQVRRMLEAVGHQVSSLRRIKFGPIEIEGVAIGTYRQLLPGEVHLLRKAATSKTKVAKAKNVAPRARKISPASPISAAERARRKEVVRSARAAKSSSAPKKFARRDNVEAETKARETSAPQRSTTRTQSTNAPARSASNRGASIGTNARGRTANARATGASGPRVARPTASNRPKYGQKSARQKCGQCA